jgi:hypothetical protein
MTTLQAFVLGGRQVLFIWHTFCGGHQAPRRLGAPAIYSRPRPSVPAVTNLPQKAQMIAVLVL